MRSEKADKIPELEPEIITHGPAVIDFPTPNLTDHDWKQRGTMVECSQCRYPHGFAVPPDQLLTGVDPSGKLIFKSISN